MITDMTERGLKTPIMRHMAGTGGFAVADHFFTRYAGVLRVDGEVGVKQDYLASTWLDKGRTGMAARVVQACEELKSAGRTLTRTVCAAGKEEPRTAG